MKDTRKSILIILLPTLVSLGAIIGIHWRYNKHKSLEANLQELEHLREENKDLKSQNKVYKEMTLRIMEKFDIKK